MLARYARSAGSVQTARRLQHRPEDHHRAARPRVLRGRPREADRDVLGRLADAHRARASCCSDGPASCCSTSRRTTSTSTRATGSRNTSSRLPARRHPRLARPLLPRRRRHAHHGDRPAHADRLRRATTRDYLRERDARHGAAPPAEARPGRRNRADAGVHQSLPLSGDQGVAGPEPDQDARQDRADRDPARAQARALHVSRRARRAAAWCSSCKDVRRRTATQRVFDGIDAAHRARRSHRAHRPERRGQVDADAHALRRRGAGRRHAHAKATRS